VLQPYSAFQFPAAPPELVVGGRRSITAYDVSKNRKSDRAFGTPDRPYEIFAAEQNDLRNLTQTERCVVEAVQTRAC